MDPLPTRLRAIRLSAILRGSIGLLGLGCGTTGQSIQAAELNAGTHAAPESLTVGTITYHAVQIRSVNTRSLVISHRDGLASIRLQDLPPDWQKRFNYDPTKEPVGEATPYSALPPPIRRSQLQPINRRSPIDDLLGRFGQPASLATPVDLRPKLFKFELGVKNQGRRPSCAVFAIVSALEFQRAELTGQAEKFSEEYLIWATRKTVQRLPTANSTSATEPSSEDADEGFALFEVVEALRAYGIPLQASMPNIWNRPSHALLEPPPDIIQSARRYQRVFVHQVPGRDAPTRLNNIIHALQAGLPVPIGLAWPAGRISHGFIGPIAANPNAGHAVTLVGWQSATGQMKDAIFIFKNSWGPKWGQGGYGHVTYAYLRQNLHDAVWLELAADIKN
jgi:hypothetical protein